MSIHAFEHKKIIIFAVASIKNYRNSITRLLYRLQPKITLYYYLDPYPQAIIHQLSSLE